MGENVKSRGGSSRRVGILGLGLMGGKVATIFARAGHDWYFSDARSEQKLKRLAREVKKRDLCYTQ